ncbi:fluoride efflux transporter CrcB [Pueribacillus sp. YX66]|uniref:fluoride efflux transporter CrcB n=1 Tax=Pueribacillus sp. YX66 TaxID=3229242 RepID=UPI00358CE0EC
MLVFLLVGIAGAIGAVLRYSLSIYFPFAAGDTFPFATVIANLLGSLILALLISFFSGKRQLSEKVEAIIYTGLIGSFTTFSAFSVETLELLQNDAYFLAFTYVIISAVGGFLIAMFGYSIGKRFKREGGTAS